VLSSPSPPCVSSLLGEVHKGKEWPPISAAEPLPRIAGDADQLLLDVLAHPAFRHHLAPGDPIRRCSAEGRFGQAWALRSEL